MRARIDTADKGFVLGGLYAFGLFSGGFVFQGKIFCFFLFAVGLGRFLCSAFGFFDYSILNTVEVFNGFFLFLSVVMRNRLDSDGGKQCVDVVKIFVPGRRFVLLHGFGLSAVFTATGLVFPALFLLYGNVFKLFEFKNIVAVIVIIVKAVFLGTFL